MPQRNQQPLASTLATVSGCLSLFGSLLLTLKFPALHIGIAIAIGGVLGAPLIVLGLRLGEQTPPDDVESRRFWPTRVEGSRVCHCALKTGQ